MELLPECGTRGAWGAWSFDPMANLCGLIEGGVDDEALLTKAEVAEIVR